MTPSAVAADTLPQPSDSTAVRSYVLRTSRLDGIPGLVELTALYIGAFVALLIAVTLMALKEYAKEALGLSEHSCCTDVIIGGARASKGDGSIRPASTGYHRFPGDSAFCKRGFGSSGLVLGEES